MSKDVLLDADARSNFLQLNAFSGEFEDCTLGDIQNGHIDGLCVLAGEGNLLNSGNDLVLLAFLVDDQLAILNMDLQAASSKGAAEDNLLSVLGDVDEAAAASDTGTELGNVDVALLVHLSKAEVSDVQVTTIVEVELVGLVKDAVSIGSSTEVAAAAGNATDSAALSSQTELIANAFFGCNDCNAFGNADTQVNNSVGNELHCCAASHDLALAHCQRCNSVQGNADLAGEGRIVLGAIGLHVLVRIGLDDCVDIDAGDLDEAGLEVAVLDNVFDLCNDDTAAGLCSLCDGDGLSIESLVLEGEVALGVSESGTDDSNVNVLCVIEQLLLAADGDQLNRILCLCQLVELAALEAGVNEGSQTDMGDGAGLAASDITEHVGDNTLGEVVGCALVLKSELLNLGLQTVVAADDLGQKAFFAEVVQASFLAVALASSVHNAQIAGMTGCEEGFLNSGCNVLRENGADETGSSQHVAVLNESNSFCSSNKFRHI